MGNGDIRIRATPNDARVATPAIERIGEFEARKYNLPRRVDERGQGENLHRATAERAVKLEVFYAMNLQPRVLLREFRLFFCQGPVRQPPTPDVPRKMHTSKLSSKENATSPSPSELEA